MALAMTSPTKNPRSGVYRIRMAIPPHLRDITERAHGRRVEFIKTLGTKDPREARRLAPAVVEEFQARIRAAEAEHRDQHVTLSDRDVSALCGRWLAAREAEARDNIPESAEHYSERADYLGDVLRGLEDPDSYDGDPVKGAAEVLADDLAALLASEGLAPDQDTRDRLITRLAHVAWQHARDMERRARQGTWRPSVTSADFPAAVTKRTGAPSPAVTFDVLLQGFAHDKGWGLLDAKPIPRPLYDRKRTLARLAEFLGHTDATKVAKADAVRWKEEMQGRNLHDATIRNDLSKCSAVWKWAIRCGKLPEGTSNPFEGISPPKPAKRGRAVRGFTPAEAVTILTAARGQSGVLRWLPWVCAMTGARLNEVCQSVKEDVATVGSVPVLSIHDDGDGRSVKNEDSIRTLPLHPTLVQEGFLRYVAALPAGSPLFPDVKPDAVFGLRSTTAGRKVAHWLRETLGLDDDRLSPNHSWRHYFTDACRRVSMPIEVRSALTGHSAKMDESAGYGEGVGSMLAVMAQHLAKVAAPVPPADAEREAA